MVLLKKYNGQAPSCGLDNDCCDNNGAPILLVVGENNVETLELHHRGLEAAELVKEPLIVKISYDTEKYEKLSFPALFIKGELASKGSVPPSAEIEELLKAFIESSLE